MSDIVPTWDSTTGVAEFFVPMTLGGQEYPDAALIRFADMDTTRDKSIKATVSVNWNLTGPRQGFVKEGDLLLGKGTGPWSRDLSKLVPEVAEGQWAAVLEATSKQAKSFFEMGEPFLKLGENEPPPMQYLLRPMVAASGGTIFAAAGGTGKSLLAVAICLTVSTGRRDILGFNPKRTGPSIYFDWEESGDPYLAREAHDERVYALCRNLGIDPRRLPHPIYYSRERVPLHVGVKSINRKILDLSERPVLAVVDSVGKAMGGDPNSASDTIAFFNAADQLRMPFIGIHHKSKAAIEYGKKGPTGSHYATDLARTVWDIESVQLSGQDRVQVVAKNSKVNRTRKQDAIAWDITFENDDTPGAERLLAVSYEQTSMFGFGG